MKICISLAGEKTKREDAINEMSDSDLLIAADGGYDILREYGIEPDFFIGDMDSTTFGDIPEKTITILAPAEKDQSDSELAVDFALSKKPSKIVLINALGKRPDHLFSNISLLFKKTETIEILDDHWTITALSGPCSYRLQKAFEKQMFSIFAFGDSLKGLTMKGFKYELDDCDVDPGSRGLSNHMISDIIEVSFREGKAVIFIERDPGGYE
ncbi:thiamine diphosphokinase [candidate division WOR-3 bacterium]|nr:thiamine diphosphokinase [candidate division WOR-3 bacterium]